MAAVVELRERRKWRREEEEESSIASGRPPQLSEQAVNRTST